MTILADADRLGLLLAAGAAAVLLSLPVRGNRRNERVAGRGWACLSIVLYAGGYILIFVEPRYLWPIFGVLLALTVVVLEAVATVVAAAVKRPGGAIRAAVAGLLLVSLAMPVGGTFAKWRYQFGPGGRTPWLRRAAEEVALSGQLVGNKWYETLYHAYRGDAVLLGSFTGRDPAAVAETLRLFGTTHVLIFDDVELAERFDRHPAFTPAGQSIRKETGESLYAFTYAGDGKVP